MRPLARVVTLESVDISAPSVQASRSRAGVISPGFSGTPVPQNAPKNIAARADSTRAAAENMPIWKVVLNRFAVHQGALAWRDDSTTPQAQNSLTAIELQAQGIQWPFGGKAASFEGSLALPNSSATPAPKNVCPKTLAR